MSAQDARGVRDSGGEAEDRDLLTIEDEEAEEVLNAVASETAREILASVRETESAPAEISERLGTSTQNVRYHLDKLEAAGVVAVAGMKYSEKGREMSVYEVSESPPVVVIGSLDEGECASRGGGDDDSGEEYAEDDSRKGVTRLNAEDERRGTSRPRTRPGER